MMSEDEYGCLTLGRELGDAPDPKWIQTFTGRAFYPLSPRAEDVCIEDIAHALAMKCRYTGHCREFYSVAQHSVHASYIVPPEDRLWALLHDAAEAYLPDVARPIKRYLPNFHEMEWWVTVAVAVKFGMMPSPNRGTKFYPKLLPDSVKAADLQLLSTEARDLMPNPPYRWRSIEGVRPCDGIIRPMPPADAEREFLARFSLLTTGAA